MMSGIKYEQGHILIVPFPFADLSGMKQRPVLVVSKKDYNDRSADLLVSAITSHLKDAPYSVFVSNPDLESGTLPTVSRIQVDKLFSVNKDVIVKAIGKVNRKVLSEVKQQFCDLVM